MTVSCPRCRREVPETRTCTYCEALLTTNEATMHGMDAQEWMREALRAARLKQLERAVSCIDNALEIDPEKHPGAWFNRGLLLADLGRLSEAVASLEQAIILDPAFERAVEARARISRDPRAVLPPGRPGQTMLEMLADGGPAEAYAMTSSTALFQKLHRFAGPEEIAAMNWIVAVPSCCRAADDHAVDAGTDAGASADTDAEADADADAEVLFHVVVRDKSAYTFRHAGAAVELPDALLPQKELEAFRSLLARGTVRSIGVCASRPFSAATFARVEAINDGLTKLDVASHARVELLVLGDEDDHDD